MKRYLVLIGDGMSDWPLKELGGRTPLAAARTPNLDFLARNGRCGWVSNVPKGLPPASDVANMSIFGYDPKKYYTGRGPLEAASLGIKLGKSEVAFRCNLVTVKDRRMKDFTAGHINTAEGRRIMKLLDKKLGCQTVKFYPGLSYRHLLVVSNELINSRVRTTPPHDITGKPIKNYLPGGKGSEILLQLMNESEVLLHGIGTKASMIWPWSPGQMPAMPLFRKKFGKKAAIITAVHLLKGIGKLVGMDVINVPGATGYLDTNYLGKARAAWRALKDRDLAFIHVEAPDEAGHEGSVSKKIRAIEDFDRLIVGTLLKKIRSTGSDVKILVLPDHPTPIRAMTHTADPVPFVLYDPNKPCSKESINAYNEKELKKASWRLRHGHDLLKELLKA
ncbi:MAG: cofactor-independent phosphoglycerate mutase [Candidatus Saganbacteria bacterium]|nr:cofactor-independent phosphoglycerate mutase [Candidatus Saganbacteria bacterium]